MFRIDLLKGQGIPIRSRPAGIAIAAVTTLVPLVAGTVMFSFYVHDRIIVSINRQRAASYTTKINGLSEAVRLQESLGKEKSDYGNRLSEVKSSLGRYTQWSPVLAAMVESMPDTVALTAVEVKQSSVKKKVPKKDSPGTTTDVTVPVTTLRLSLYASPQSDSDKAIRDFRDQLRSSSFLGPKLDNIIVSQEIGTLDGREVVSYEMDCVFKPKL